MATLTTTTTIQGRLNGVSVSITLTSILSDVISVLDRTANITSGLSMQSLDAATPRAPYLDNAEVAYIRFDTMSGSGDALNALDTVGGTSEGRYVSDPGQWVELFRAEAGGIFAENNTATTSTLEQLLKIEQTPRFASCNASLLVAFKLIS